MSSWLEPEWDDEQSDLIRAEAEVSQLTGRGGEWLPEATNPGADPTEYSTPYRYVAKGPFVNWHEKERLDAVEAHRKAMGDNANMNGVYFTAEKVDF